MNQEGLLLRENVEATSTASVSAETLRVQQTTLSKAEAKLQRMEQRVIQCRDQVRQLRVVLAKARSRYKEKKTPQLKRSCNSAMKKFKTAIDRRNETVSKFPELKLLVRDQRATYKKLERERNGQGKDGCAFY